MLKPTLAEIARTTLATAMFGNLAVLDSTGRPIVKSVPIVDDGSGRPVTVISNLAGITARAMRDPRAGMNIADRLLIQGDLRPVPGIQQLEIQNHFIAHHPTLLRQVESLDFSWFVVAATAVCWIDDDGSEIWLRPVDMAGAEPDPLGHFGDFEVAEIAERIGDDLIVMVRGLSGLHKARRAELVGIDRYGLKVLIDEPGVRRTSRVPFSERLGDSSEIHAAIAALAQAARNTPSAAEAEMATTSAAWAPATLLESIEGNGGSRSDVD